ncbi:MAG: AI-2E family transporter [Thermoleophilaceae bacterium]|nr:AI-2E family transporter [Thermoleophilaceae bacterium]
MTEHEASSPGPAKFDAIESTQWEMLNTIAGFSWRFLVSVMALAVGIFVLVELNVIVVPLLLALLGTAILSPAVVWLRKHGFSAGLASLVTMLAALALLFAAAAFIIPQLVTHGDDIVRAMKDAFEQILTWLQGDPVNMSQDDVDALRLKVTTGSSGLGDILLSGVSTLLPVVAKAVTTLMLAVVLTGYMLVDGDRYWRWMLGFVAPERRVAMDALGRSAHGTLANYIRGTASVAVVDSVFIGIGLYVLDVPLIPMIMLLVFFGAFLPIIGAWLSGAVAVLVALSSGGIQDAVAVTVLILIVQQLEGIFLQPFLVGKKVSLAPIVTLTTVTAGTVLAGVIGGILAVPLMATTAGALGEVRRWRATGEAPGGPSEMPGDDPPESQPDALPASP